MAVVENMAYLASPPSISVREDGVTAVDDVEDEKWETVEGAIQRIVESSTDDVTAELKSRGLSTEGDEAELRARCSVAAMKEVVAAQGESKNMLFGRGHSQRLSDMWGIENTLSLPLDAHVAAHGDGGVPLSVGQPDHPNSKVKQTTIK